MLPQFADIVCACLSAEHLAVLAELRARPGIQILLQADTAWVRWDGSDDAILRRLLPVPGVTLFSWRDGNWYRLGSVLPAFDVPNDGQYRPLHDVLFPSAILPVPPPAGKGFSRAIVLGLVRDLRPRPTSALLASVSDVLAWADTVPSFRLASLRAACQGERVLISGQRLPVLRVGQRLWGQSILRPLGFRLEPDLSEATIRNAFAIKEGDLLIVSESQTETVPADVLQPLDRAGLRRAAREVRP